MDRLDKTHKINVAYDLIKRVFEDTDDDKWGYRDLEDAMASLENWFEESASEIQGEEIWM